MLYISADSTIARELVSNASHLVTRPHSLLLHQHTIEKALTDLQARPAAHVLYHQRSLGGVTRWCVGERVTDKRSPGLLLHGSARDCWCWRLLGCNQGQADPCGDSPHTGQIFAERRHAHQRNPIAAVSMRINRHTTTTTCLYTTLSRSRGGSQLLPPTRCWARNDAYREASAPRTHPKVMVYGSLLASHDSQRPDDTAPIGHETRDQKFRPYSKPEVYI
jgi:hypothetical protein